MRASFMLACVCDYFSSFKGRWGITFLASLLFLVSPVSSYAQTNPDGALRIELIAGYNFVVRSNIESQPGTSPQSAYLAAKFCNDGDTPLTNVVANIGDFDGGVSPTPGIYPISDPNDHPNLVGPLGGAFALQHEGGILGTADATRFIGTIEPGECVAVYWLVSYPLVDENGTATHRPSVKPDDDLFLDFDVWGTAYDQGTELTADTTRTVFMRNMLQAQANKIQPNNANKVPQEYLDLLAIYAPTWTNNPTDGSPGTSFFTEGYWYDLGNINQGFDNDGDLVPDYNAWLQPVGDPSQFDPSCFRLVGTRTLLVIKRSGGQPDFVVVAEDELYFTNLPPDNRGGIGLVIYEFMPLRSGCTSQLSPYQAVASGRDNEKFNGDYGATLGGGLFSTPSSAGLEKEVDLDEVSPGGTLTYTINFTNAGTVAIGQPSQGVPLVVQDAIPMGTTYVSGSAELDNTLPTGVTAYSVFYSTNNGASWTLSEPSPASDVTDLQWWLSDPLPVAASGTVTFEVEVDSASPPPVIVNVAGLSFGNTLPFLTDDASTLLLGLNSISGTVFGDTGVGGGITGDGEQNGDEPGLPGILVTLYYDVDGDGEIGPNDIVVATQFTDADGDYAFENLVDGNYIVHVDRFDPALPDGYSPTIPPTQAVDLDADGLDPDPVSVEDVDFGFAPNLALEKTGGAETWEGDLVTYDIAVINTYAGTGSGDAVPVTVEVWATNEVASLTLTGNTTEWTDRPNAYDGPPNGTFATATFNNNPSRVMGLGGYTATPDASSITNVSVLIPYTSAVGFSAGDFLTISVRTNSDPDVAVAFTTNIFLNTIPATGVITQEVFGALTWDWDRFDPVNSNLFIRLSTTRSGGQPSGRSFSVDQAGFRVQTDGVIEVPCRRTINPAPLYDFFDTNILSFVSADPMPSSVSTDGPAPNEGQLFWSNVGPIFPGGTSSVQVTFRVLEPPGNVLTDTTNTAVVVDAFRACGAAVNSATSTASSVVNPTGMIGDFVWSDLNGDGNQDAGEPGIPGVSVVLTPPAGVDLGNGDGNPITNVTDSTGFYLFAGLRESGDYTVTVLESTLPGGSGINTFTRDGVLDSETIVSLDVTSTTGGDTILDADFGYTDIDATIRGTVWNDVDRSATSTPDPNEPRFENVTVELRDDLGNLVDSTTTDVNGEYVFTGNFDGDYTVIVLTNTLPTASGEWEATYDTDGIGTLHEVTVSVSPGGQEEANFSYADIGLYSIGDTVFIDWNGNGIQDPNDVGLAGVTMLLYLDTDGTGLYDPTTDPLVATTVTDGNGNYLFEELPPGDYIVIMDKDSPSFPPVYVITADPEGPLDGRAAVEIIDDDRLDIDFGVQPIGFASIGDTVWRDLNGDGVQAGPQETGIANVTVALQADVNGDGNYQTIRTTVTDANGNYLFDEVPDGNYRVVVSRFDPGIPTDNFGEPWRHTTDEFVLVEIENGWNIFYDFADFGFAPSGAIGDTIFWDANRNGQQDLNEPGIEGVLVELYLDGVLFDSQYTDEDGNYLFAGLAPGNYTVVVVQDDGEPDYPLLDSELIADPDADGVPCWSPFAIGCDNQTEVELLIGQAFLGADFGYDLLGGNIGGTLWVDFDGNDEIDPGETRLAFIPVELYDNGTLIATTQTDVDGFYQFFGLGDGTYSVRVVTDDAEDPLPSGLSPTFDRDGVFDNVTTNIVIDGGSVISVDGVACTACDLNNDFGYRYAGDNSLRGTVGLDDPDAIDGVLNGANISGVGPNEVAFAGVTVFVYLWHDLNDDGIVDPGETTLVGTTVTDANGDYIFTDLPDGFDDNPYYIVSLTAPINNIVLTTEDSSTPNPSFLVVDNQNLQGNTVSAYQAVEIDETITNLDFAFISTLVYDFGDLPESYSTLLPNGPRHAVNDPADLFLGQGVSTEPNGQPSAMADLDDFDDGVTVLGIWQNGEGGGTIQIEVGEGTGRLLGFIDFNSSGAFDQANEFMLDEVVSSDGGPGNDGVYEFDFDVPQNSLSLTDTTILYSRFRLFPTNEFIFIPQLAFQGEASNGEVEDYRWVFNAINGSVFWDAENEEAFTTNNVPQAGVIIRLLDDEDNVVAETVTRIDGAYTFYGLPNGDYRIEMETPIGSEAILDADGDTENEFFEIDVSLNENSVVEQDFLLDVQPTVGSIGGTVWEDDGFGVEGNGLFDAPDEPVSGVLVSLYRDINGDGEINVNEFVASTITDLNGEYLFEDLPDGDYIVFMSTPSGADSIDDADGDANGTDLIQVEIENGDDVEEQDFLIDGASPFAELSGLVWFDANRNSIRDGSETNRFAGVMVDLLDAATNVVMTTTTAGDGTYSFTSITAGFYTVRFDLTSLIDDFDVANPFAGNDRTRDSDVTLLEGVFAFTDQLLLLASESEENIDLGLQTPVPTLASIADVWGEWTGQAEVVWQADSEHHTAAYRLYRVDQVSGEETLLTPDGVAVLPFSDRPIYRVVDPAAEEGQAVTVRLEEVEIAGRIIDLGTFDVTFGAPRPVARRVAGAMPREQTTQYIQSTFSGPETSECLKVEVTREGLYAVTLESIAHGMGEDIELIRDWAQAGEIGISTEGEPVPYRFDLAGDRLIFYGRPTSNWYAENGVYWIRREAALWMQGRDAGTDSGIDHAQVTLRMREQSYPSPHRMTLPREWYYWGFVMAGVDQVIAFDLPAYHAGSVDVRVNLAGATTDDMVPNHRAHMIFNETLVDAVEFNDQEEITASFTVPETLLSAGNTLVIHNNPVPGLVHQWFTSESVEVDYRRALVPGGDAIILNVQDEDAFSAAAFEAPVVIALRDEGEPVWIEGPSEGVSFEAWLVESEDDRFVLAESAAIQELGVIPGTCTGWFMASDNRIDYLVITTRALESAAQELVDYRAAQGLRGQSVLFEELVDVFAHGIRTPEAIREFLRYAHTEWTEAPWLVVLAGGGHMDYLNRWLSVVNHIPPVMLASPEGVFASDIVLADLFGDNQHPDVALGRLPARTAGELQVMIDKIKAYEAQHGEDWHNTVVLAAGKPDAAGDFTESSERLATAAVGASISKLYRSDLGFTAMRNQLLSHFQSGAGIIHYTGHGNQSSFMNEGRNGALLGASDVNGLNNAQQPIVIALTCLAGRFDNPQSHSLAERLLNRNGGGAVAMWSSSGKSYNAPATRLGEAFYRALYDEGVSTLGLAIQRAHQQMEMDPIYGSTYLMYNLLGDPAMNLGAIEGSGHGAQGYVQWRWERFAPADLSDDSISGAHTFAHYALGNGYIEAHVGAGARGAGVGLLESVMEDEGQFVYVRWQERVNRAGVDYVLLTSTDLIHWETPQEDLEIVSQMHVLGTDMNEVIARLPFVGDRLYVRIKLLRN